MCRTPLLICLLYECASHLVWILADNSAMPDFCNYSPTVTPISVRGSASRLAPLHAMFNGLPVTVTALSPALSYGHLGLCFAWQVVMSALAYLYRAFYGPFPPQLK